ncbi:hypothetical protein [Granulosicoccus antarcticus]|uniref:Uncharacterized protein n=1 Tax=Granulosicoccus antarcticus IMCC3135 TaxID=1192854 RepID=A0A2Z2NKL9_9GAMM|nr:hypothetical protein [Granulosicoccus antarcticus]ASJ71942.1 hypothetical protein IMCC3135_09225 [Granulosicoccus antarcticus IMCC3135]
MQQNCDRQVGSALTETIILSIAMVPLFFAIPMIGKLADIRQTGEQAARYGSWEATVNTRGSGAATIERTEERFFKSQNSAIASIAQDLPEHSLWGNDRAQSTGYRGDTDVRIDLDASAARAWQYDFTGQPAGAIIGEQAGRVGKLLDGIGSNDWSIESNALVRSGVEIEVKANNWLREDACSASQNAGCLSVSSVIMADSWGAGSESQAKNRVKSLVPASALEPVGDMMAIVGEFPIFKEMKGLKGALGHVDMGVLPDYAKGE